MVIHQMGESALGSRRNDIQIFTRRIDTSAGLKSREIGEANTQDMRRIGAGCQYDSGGPSSGVANER